MVNAKSKVALALVVGIGIGWAGSCFVQLPAARGVAANQAREKRFAQRYKELVPSLRSALNDPDGNLRNQVVQVLASLGSDALPVVVSLLRSKDEQDRTNAVLIVQQMKPHEIVETVPLLLAVVNNPNEKSHLRIWALQAIGGAAKAAP